MRPQRNEAFVSHKLVSAILLVLALITTPAFAQVSAPPIEIASPGRTVP